MARCAWAPERAPILTSLIMKNWGEELGIAELLGRAMSESGLDVESG